MKNMVYYFGLKKKVYLNLDTFHDVTLNLSDNTLWSKVCGQTVTPMCHLLQTVTTKSNEHNCIECLCMF